MKQSTGVVCMVRPASFGFNAETAATNAFQTAFEADYPRVLEEFDATVHLLRSEGVEVWVYDEQPGLPRPDAIFPNNWLGFHPGKKLVLYPMMAENRRLERDPDLLRHLTAHFAPRQTFDFSPYEAEGRFLEGTGSLVFDHLKKNVFVALSPRSNRELAEEVARQLGYTCVFFETADDSGQPVYHTNVVLSIGTRFCLAGFEYIHPGYHEALKSALAFEGRMLIPLNAHEIRSFGANVLELENDAGEQLIVISHTAINQLRPESLLALRTAGLILPVDVTSIERVGGGGIRCMLCEIFTS